MTISLWKGAAALATCAAFAAAPAAAEPDLVVRSIMVDEASISCETREPLVSITVLLENIGEDDADFGLQRSVVGAAVDDAPYTWEMTSTANDIDVGERASFKLEIGKGHVKQGRIGRVVGGGVELFVPTTAAQQNQLPRALKVRIQQELIALGFLGGSADGALGRGSQAAIRQFQQSRGEQETGVLTAAQTDDLLAGGPSRQSYFGAEREFRIIVVVDPNSRMDEANEGNNVAFSDTITLRGC